MYGTNDDLVAGICKTAPWFLGGGLRNPRVLDAMRATDRAEFLPSRSRAWAYIDAPVEIGDGQTCSQPSLVAFMLDELDLGPGQRVLEIGAGCGYAAAIAARLCAPDGVVVAAEIQPALAFLCRANCAVFGPRVEVVEADASTGLPGRDPFDRILVSAGVRPSSFREELLAARLSDNGVLIYPERRGLLHRVERRGAAIHRRTWQGVAFVPLLGLNS